MIPWRCSPYLLVLLLVAMLAYLTASLVYHEFVLEGHRTRITSELCHIRNEAANHYQFRKERNRLPSGFADIGIEVGRFADPVSGKPWLWLCDPCGSRKNPRVAICQPEPYRTWLWPFGHWERYGLFTDGDIKQIPPFFDKQD